MIVKKIISDGQTGAAIASLDAALGLSIDYGGCLPKGRNTENGALDAKYLGMEELDVQDDSLVVAQNIRNSEGTVVFTHGELLGITRFTHELAIQLSKPVLHLNLDVLSENKALDLLSVWILENQIGVINVTGTLESEDQYIYDEVYAIVKALLQRQNTAMLHSPPLTLTEKTQPSKTIIDKDLPKGKKRSSKKKKDKSSETLTIDALQKIDKDTFQDPGNDQPFSLSPESALLESIILEAQQDSISMDFDLTLPEESQENIADSDQTLTVDNLPVTAEIIADKISQEEDLEFPASRESAELPIEQEVTPLAENSENIDILEIEDEEIKASEGIPSSEETTIPIVVEAFEIISDEEPSEITVFDADKTTIIEEVKSVEEKGEGEQEVVIPESSENADLVIERREVEKPVIVARPPSPQHVPDSSTMIVSQDEERDNISAIQAKKRNLYLVAAVSALVLICLFFMAKALRQSSPANDLTKSPTITANNNEKPPEAVNNAALSKTDKAILNVETTQSGQKTKESVPMTYPQSGQDVSKNGTTPISEEPNRPVGRDQNEQKTERATGERDQNPVTNMQREEGIHSAATDNSPAKVDAEEKHQAGPEATSEAVTPSMGVDQNGKGQHLSSDISGKARENKGPLSEIAEKSSSLEQQKGNGTVPPPESLTSDEKGEKKQTVQPKKPTNEPNRCASLYKKMSLGTVLTETEMSYLANKCK